MGGDPYESIRPQAVIARMKNFGFEPDRSHTHGYSIGFLAPACDEYVFQRT